MWWRDVARLVPQTRTLLDVAMEVTRPAVRTGDPVIELGDPLARLHWVHRPPSVNDRSRRSRAERGAGAFPRKRPPVDSHS